MRQKWAVLHPQRAKNAARVWKDLAAGYGKGAPGIKKHPPASSPSSPTSPNGAQARVHNACAHRSTPTAQPWTPAQPGQPGHHKRPRVHNACARSFHLAAAAQRNTMNAQAPAGTRICARVREIAGGRSGGSWTKWTLKRPPAPTFARAYARDTSTKADASGPGLVLRTPPWRQAKAAPPSWTPTAARAGSGGSWRAQALARV